MQGSVQGENVGALVQKKIFTFLCGFSPPSWYLFYLLFNVAFLKQRLLAAQALQTIVKCPMPHPDVIEAVRACSHSTAVIARLEVPLCQQ